MRRVAQRPLFFWPDASPALRNFCALGARCAQTLRKKYLRNHYEISVYMAGERAARWSSPMKSISRFVSLVPVVRCSSHRLFRAVSLLASVSAFSVGVFAQNAAPNDQNGSRRQRGGDSANGGGDNGGKGGRGNFDPAQMQERLREQFGVTDDAEWTLISERLTKLSEIRRTAGGGMGRGGPGGPSGPGGGPGGPSSRGGRGGPSGNPEQDSLRAAIMDKLPDAEVKSRLERLREVRKQNEAKVARAQEELRAVLSVRQEAVAVMFGLLP
jgi:hypothetical protein